MHNPNPRYGGQFRAPYNAQNTPRKQKRCTETCTAVTIIPVRDETIPELQQVGGTSRVPYAHHPQIQGPNTTSSSDCGWCGSPNPNGTDGNLIRSHVSGSRPPVAASGCQNACNRQEIQRQNIGQSLDTDKYPYTSQSYGSSRGNYETSNFTQDSLNFSLQQDLYSVSRPPYLDSIPEDAQANYYGSPLATSTPKRPLTDPKWSVLATSGSETTDPRWTTLGSSGQQYPESDPRFTTYHTVNSQGPGSDPRCIPSPACIPVNREIRTPPCAATNHYDTAMSQPLATLSQNIQSRNDLVPSEVIPVKSSDASFGIPFGVKKDSFPYRLRYRIIEPQTPSSTIGQNSPSFKVVEWTYESKIPSDFALNPETITSTPLQPEIVLEHQDNARVPRWGGINGPSEAHPRPPPEIAIETGPTSSLQSMQPPTIGPQRAFHELLDSNVHICSPYVDIDSIGLTTLQETTHTDSTEASDKPLEVTETEESSLPEVPDQTKSENAPINETPTGPKRGGGGTGAEQDSESVGSHRSVDRARRKLNFEETN